MLDSHIFFKYELIKINSDFIGLKTPRCIKALTSDLSTFKTEKGKRSGKRIIRRSLSLTDRRKTKKFSV